jgi:hypothetical protein
MRRIVARWHDFTYSKTQRLRYHVGFECFLKRPLIAETYRFVAVTGTEKGILKHSDGQAKYESHNLAGTAIERV